jgi:hypothetical protein
VFARGGGLRHGAKTFFELSLRNGFGGGEAVERGGCGFPALRVGGLNRDSGADEVESQKQREQAAQVCCHWGRVSSEECVSG